MGRMDRKMGLDKDMDEDTAMLLLPVRRASRQQMDHPKRTGAGQIRHHKKAFYYTFSYLLHVYAYITSYAQMREGE